MANGMIERVARALADIRFIHLGGADGQTLVPGTPNWEFCIEDARAVIMAMRPATDDMRRAFWDAEDPTDTGFRDAWYAAIDAALSD